MKSAIWAAFAMFAGCAGSSSGGHDLALAPDLAPAPSCSDGRANGGESAVDCGGPCPKCGAGKECRVDGDCDSGVCFQRICAMAGCADKVQNGAETDVDCGGSTCPKCAAGKLCAKDADCESAHCLQGGCLGASCNDNLQNQGEGDVDCGGPCPPCAVGKRCGGDADCDKSICSAGACAVAPACRDLHSAQPMLPDGAYPVDPDGAAGSPPFTAWCDMTGDGGGWTLVLKTDKSNTSDYVGGAVNAGALTDPGLNAVAKLDDAVIRALQTTNANGAETRVETPSFPARLFAKGNYWSVPKPNNYPMSITTKHQAADPYVQGLQCYDSDQPACGADHFCFGAGVPNNGFSGEHGCIRRLAGAGIWLNFGAFGNGGYYAGRVWVR
jgi:hypothetical protein